MDMEINGKNRLYLIIMLSLLLAFGVEVFLFNCQYFSTKRESEIVVPLDYCSYQGLKEQAEDGSMILDGGEEDIYVQFSVKDSGVRLKNLALQISCTNGDELWWGYLRKPYARLASTGVEAAVLVSGKGENKVLRDRLLYGRSGEKDIINLPDMEGAEEITLQLKGVKGSELKLSGIYLNSRVPLNVMPIRVFALFLFFCFCVYVQAGLRTLDGQSLWRERQVEKTLSCCRDNDICSASGMCSYAYMPESGVYAVGERIPSLYRSGKGFVKGTAVS